MIKALIKLINWNNLANIGKKDPKFMDLEEWRWQGGGVINAFLIHIIDLIQWLLDSKINEIVKSKNRIIIPQKRLIQIQSVTAEDFAEVDFILK